MTTGTQMPTAPNCMNRKTQKSPSDEDESPSELLPGGSLESSIDESCPLDEPFALDSFALDVPSEETPLEPDDSPSLVRLLPESLSPGDSLPSEPLPPESLPSEPFPPELSPPEPSLLDGPSLDGSSLEDLSSVCESSELADPAELSDEASLSPEESLDDPDSSELTSELLPSLLVLASEETSESLASDDSSSVPSLDGFVDRSLDDASESLLGSVDDSALDESALDELSTSLESDEVNSELVTLSEISLDDSADEVSSDDRSLDVARLEDEPVEDVPSELVPFDDNVPVLEPLVPVSSVSCVLVRSDRLGPASVSPAASGIFNR
jgi:hypothetical protein